MAKLIDQGGKPAVLERLGLTERQLSAKIAWELELYVTGSAIRDPLLGLEPADVDYVVVGANELQMKRLGFDCVGNEFPCFLHPITRDDYALARRERKIGPGHTGFECDIDNVTIEDDLVRRDLTVNAIARRVGSDEIIDPLGGMADLENRILRHCSEAYAEDPLRVLRTCRFMTKCDRFEIAPETMELMRSLVDSGELDTLTPERIFLEWEKALGGNFPERFFTSMDECGALERLFPEIHALKGQFHSDEFHPEGDAWVHTLYVLRVASYLTDDIALRFGAMVHDLGKGLTPKEELPKHHGHAKKGLPLINDICDRLKAPNEWRKMGLLAADTHHRIHDLDVASAGTLRKLCDKLKAKHGDALVDAAILMATADHKGRGPVLEATEHPHIHILRTAVPAYRAVKVRDNLVGEAIRTALVQDRTEAIAVALGMHKARPEPLVGTCFVCKQETEVKNSKHPSGNMIMGCRQCMKELWKAKL